MSDRKSILVETAPNPDYAIIWMHGLGADGNDFAGIVPEFNFTQEKIRFIFPHAPIQPVTVNGGHAMRSWYDIISIDDEERTCDIAGIQSSVLRIQAMIEDQIAQGIDSKRILLAGFSQGGVIAYHAGLSFTKPLAGILALSTYLPAFNAIKLHQTALPIRIDHGSFDGVVPYKLGVKAKDCLNQAGFECEFNTYPMQHNVCFDQIKSIGTWISSQFPPLGAN